MSIEKRLDLLIQKAKNNKFHQLARELSAIRAMTARFPKMNTKYVEAALNGFEHEMDEVIRKKDPNAEKLLSKLLGEYGAALQEWYAIEQKMARIKVSNQTQQNILDKIRAVQENLGELLKNKQFMLNLQELRARNMYRNRMLNSLVARAGDEYVRGHAAAKPAKGQPKNQPKADEKEEKDYSGFKELLSGIGNFISALASNSDDSKERNKAIHAAIMPLLGFALKTFFRFLSGVLKQKFDGQLDEEVDNAFKDAPEKMAAFFNGPDVKPEYANAYTLDNKKKQEDDSDRTYAPLQQAKIATNMAAKKARPTAAHTAPLGLTSGRRY